MALRELLRGLRRLDPFGDELCVAQDLLERLSFAEEHADRAIARERTGAGQDEIAGGTMTDVPPEPHVVQEIRRLDPARQFLVAEHFEVFPANLATLYEVRDAISYDALNTKPRVEQLLPCGYDPMLHTFNPILAPHEVPSLGRIGVRWVLSRGDVAGATRIGGPPPPAVGVYEVPNATPMLLPPNNRPNGLIVGAVISLIALFASAVWLRLFTLPSPELSRVRP